MSDFIAEFGVFYEIWKIRRKKNAMHGNNSTQILE